MKTFKQYLGEVRRVPSQPHHAIDIKKFTLTRFRTARVEHMELHADKVDDEYLFAVLGDEGEYIAYAHALDIMDGPGGRPTIQIRRTWVQPDRRGMGVMTALYNTLSNQGFVIISDSELSPESIAIWKKLRTYNTVKLLNNKTLEIESYDDKVFNDDQDDPVYHLILESKVYGGWFGKILNNDRVQELHLYLDQDCP
jgi:GNAT superfamily N-acetyltransferase